MGIISGTEVIFRIRGQNLVLELKTNPEQDIKFFQSLSGKLGEHELDENMFYSIISELLYQQFYEGHDILVDRVAKKRIKIRGADSIISKSITMLVKSSIPWLSGEYVDVIRNLSIDLDLDFPTMLANLSNKLRAMQAGGDDMIAMMGGQVIFSMTISEALTLFRSKVGDIVTEKLIKEAQIRPFSSKISKKQLNIQITRMLAEDYSILMNLTVLKELAKANLKFIAQRDFNIILRDMLDNLELEISGRKINRDNDEKSALMVDDDNTLDNNGLPELPSFDL